MIQRQQAAFGDLTSGLIFLFTSLSEFNMQSRREQTVFSLLLCEAPPVMGVRL